MFKIISLSLLLMMSLNGLTGCNTINGFGKDLQQGGHALSKAAKDA